MSKDKDKLDFSELESVLDFLENEAPSETSLKQSQIARERYYNPAYKEKWYKKNTARLNSATYRKKLSEGTKKYHMENPNAAKERANTPEAIANKKKAMQKVINSPDYVNPRGMLGKKKSEETKRKHSEAVSGRAKPLEGNKKVSQANKGKKHSAETRKKLSNAIKGKITGRSRGVNTTVKNFDKVVDAARYFDVSEMSIKNWCNKKGTTIRYKSVIKKLKDKGIKLNKNNYPIGFEWAEGRENLGPQKIHTDKGIFNNADEAGKAYGIGGGSIRHRCLSDKWPEFYYLEEKSEFISPQIKG